LPPEAIDESIKQYRGAAVTSTIGAYLDDKDYGNAQSTFDKYKNDIDVNSLNTIQTHLSTVKDNQASLEGAARWLNASPGAGRSPGQGGGSTVVQGNSLAPGANLSIAPGRNVDIQHVDPRLVDVMNAGAAHLPQGYSVQINEGFNSGGHVNASQHHVAGSGAPDLQIIAPNGKPIPNEGDDTTGLYTQLAKGAYTELQRMHPDLQGKLAWGGAFGTTGSSGVPDLMHFDLGGERGDLRPQNRPSRLGISDRYQQLAGGQSRADSGIQSADAPGLIRNFEGFRAQPYWDVNHWRTGYGSDTVTRADGSVEPVTAFTKVNREDAERDLTRRVGQAQQGIQSKIGADTWRSLSPNAQAAMTSVAYNYGSLPDSVAAAAKNGGDVSQAIASLSSNPARRQREAAIAAGGGYPPGLEPASYRTGGGYRSQGGQQQPQQHVIPPTVKHYNYDAAREGVWNDNSLSIEQKQKSLTHINALEAFEDKADDSSAVDYYMKIKSGQTDGIDQAISQDPKLRPATKISLLQRLSKAPSEENDVKAMGPQYGAVMNALANPEDVPVEQRINSQQQLLNMRNTGGLSEKGLREASSWYDKLRRPETKEQSKDDLTLEKALLDSVKRKFLEDPEHPDMKNPKDKMGLDAFEQKFLPSFVAAKQAWTKTQGDKPGKPLSDFLKYDNVKDLVDTAMPTPQQRAQAELEAHMKAANEAAEAERTSDVMKKPPIGVALDKWQAVIEQRPFHKNGEKFTPDDWATGIQKLIEDPTQQNILLFDRDSALGAATYVLNSLGIKPAHANPVPQQKTGWDIAP
jgi:GH24 family phage-related lysozyme (muramidase)